MSRLVLIDGNSIMNRAFYGIMSSKMLTTSDGTYTNAIYGFLTILFKIQEDLNPDYLAVTFDLKGPTKRHELYQEYKANRHGMPEELAMQMPIIKDVLRAMNVKIVEKQGYEGDDVLGTMSKVAEEEGIEVTILSGDRDTFQLTSDKVTVRIPRTKMGKTENEDYNRERVIEEYGIEPRQLIDVKGLMGDKSDNIPGVPGIGEKTALSLIKNYKTLENLYNEVEQNENLIDVKGKTREKILENKELAFLSRKLGEIDRQAPIEEKIEDLKVTEWNKSEVYNLFKYLRFNRFIDRFNMENDNITEDNQEELFQKEMITNGEQLKLLIEKIKKEKELIYYLNAGEINENSVINKKINSISIYNSKENKSYYIDINKYNIQLFKEIFENQEIEKIGYKQKIDYILLKENNVNLTGIKYDIEIAAYIINPTENKYNIEKLAMDYLNLDINEYNKTEEKQINLFDVSEEKTIDKNLEKNCMYAYIINKIYLATLKKLEETNQLELFNQIEMPLVEVLADMQYNGIYADKEELIDFGKVLKVEIEKMTHEIYKLAGEEFNINSTKQLGTILFEKLKLPVIKKNKSGYSTDVDVLEKLKNEHEIIEKILEYRQVVKLNSTYVEGMLPYINQKDNKIHSYFHQTVTATGRISSTEPNLQNIPTRFDLGKQIRKVFKPRKGYVFLDADYSQIELRVLAHIAEDENMIHAFKNNEDIHRQTASKVFNIPIEEVTSKQRSDAKAVNFGIVYGISDFGLGEGLGISRKAAKAYIEQYLEKYEKIKEFMENMKELAKEKGYVETLFNRRRYIPEINSNNFMVRQFGARVAINAPIQGTAADIMKIAMIKLYNELKNKRLNSKLLLQIHDELLLEVHEDEKEQVKEILINSMEGAMKLKVPLKVELSEANNWYEAK